MIGAIARYLDAQPVSSWRRILVVYTAALLVGTHWPSLRVSAPTPIPLDKILHCIGFAGFASFLLLARLRPGRAEGESAFTRGNILFALGVGLAYAVADEASQALPLLGRFATWSDVVANVTGIAVAAVGMVILRRALRSYGSP